MLGVSLAMKGSSSSWAFYLGFLVGACSIYFFLCQVWFERSYHILSEAQEKATAVSERPTSWRKEGAALTNPLHSPHEGNLQSSTLVLYR